MPAIPLSHPPCLAIAIATALKGKVDAREIDVVGAYYDLDTGKVVFLKDSQAE